jgi:hypothetical protein
MMKHHKDGKSTSESRDVREFFGQTRKKPEPDDKPRRAAKDKNSGTSVAKRLAGKVIG